MAKMSLMVDAGDGPVLFLRFTPNHTGIDGLFRDLVAASARRFEVGEKPFSLKYLKGNFARYAIR